jgi:signal transduction histidine kinase
MPNFASKYAIRQCFGGVLVLAIAVLCAPAGAVATRFSPIDLHHTGWTARDGAPPSIIAIAQTPDRWLWLATESGIYRFDGVRFTRFRPHGDALPAIGFWSMRLLRSGVLWIGYRGGGASRWQDGRLRSFGAAQGLPLASIVDFEEDGAGTVWAATAYGLYRFDGRRWSQAPASMGAPQGMCTLLSDRARVMWAQCESGSFALAPRAAAFVAVSGPVGLGRLAQDGAGMVWSVGNPRGEVAALGTARRAQPAPYWPRPRIAGGTVLFERDGRHAWVTRADGVMRAGPDGSGKVFGTAQGLSGSMPNCLFQDIEGNVWIGTESGLDRFRPTRLAGVALPQIFIDSPLIAAGADGALWVGATRLPRPGIAAFRTLPAERADSAVQAVLPVEPEGALVSTPGGLWRVNGGRREKVPLPPGAGAQDMYDMARDADGGLWTKVRKLGLWRLHEGVWQPQGGYPALEGSNVRCMRLDARGRMWFGFADGSVRVLDGGAVRSYGPRDGLAIGAVLQLAELDGAIWAGGANGVARFDGQGFQALADASGEPIAGVSGLAMANGTLWLNGSTGIGIVDAAELARFRREPRYRVALRRLDHLDGLRGAASTFYSSAVTGTDGKLWFTTTAGLFWLRPDSAANRLAPPVEILALRADGAAVPLDGNHAATLAPQPGRIQLDYTALSLTMPERMRFQYRLDGVDRGWQEGGPARTAEYTDLGPGSYTFRVRASNNDGVWSERDAVLGLEVAPSFHQTIWFRLLCGAALAAGLWALYRRRLARAARLASERTEARLHERERIARELHDTVLQTVQGLMLQVDAACQQLPPDAPARAGIERSLRRAAAGIDEGRDKVLDLRQHAGDQPDLVGHVCAAVCAEVPAGMRIDAASRGATRRLAPEVFAEVSALAREALRNALRHAGAASISVQADYGDDVFTLAVTDDGCGIPQEVREAGARAGHWGLVGMRERACRIGAELVLESAPGAGTRVALRLAAARAYAAI